MKLNRFFFALLLSFCCTASFAQNTNTMYFMDEISTRNSMNPAFLPRCKSYFDFILLPNIYAGITNNALSLSDIFYLQNGGTSSVFANNASVDKFLNNLPSVPSLGTDLKLNIMNFGAMVKPGHYLTFDFNVHVDADAAIPSDLFRFALKGTPDAFSVNHFDLSDLNINANAYATAGIGYSGRLHEQVTFGVKARFLLGLANVNSTIDRLDLDASSTEWLVNSSSRVNATTPIPLNFKYNSDGSVDFNSFAIGSFSNFRPAGYGASFDLGLTYEPVKYLVISAAVTDLGFVSWTSGYNYEATLNGSYRYDGAGSVNYGDSINTANISKRLEQLGENIKKDVRINESTGALNMINGRFNAGIEYGVLQNKISFGVMNQLVFNTKSIYDEVTLAVNFRPCQWFKAALSYSFINSNWCALGAGININLGGFSWYIISDYVPLTYSEVTYSKNGSDQKIILPDRMRSFNIQTGVVFNLHRFERDLDGDGVTNGHDACPETNMDFLRSKCPSVKDKKLVNKAGCEFDEDNDGINDCFDRCPNTPAGIAVDSVGCPLDNDHDGIPDSVDDCPDTPEDVQVDSKGCPLDSDADGIPDYIDQCPGTPQNVLVDSIGCPVDSDHDGVADYLDRCPDTPLGVSVDSNGCPHDQDGDGVDDSIDRCPDTPKNVVVDSLGCPVDTDGDGIPDYLDRCPDRAGSLSNYGCPELTAMHNIIKKAMNGIQFETAKATIKPSSYPILNQMVEILSLDTTYNLEILGHTDNVGLPENNMRLSEERAASVRDYLINHGINPKRLTSAGYGDTKPIADNKTKKGREKNRRVEFNIVYDEVTYHE